MYDGGKIIAGLLIFLVLALFPMWYDAAGGEGTSPPDLKLGTEEKECVAPTEYMRANHMDLLNQWREDVVRLGERIYVAPNGKQHDKSLTRTCLDCHSNKAEFCDRCHTWTGVETYCFDCHLEPKETPQ